MHDVELSNAVLLCDESGVEAVLALDPRRALTVDERGRTLLTTAVAQGNEANGVSLPILARLVAAGVDVNARDADGRTALGAAVGECGLEVVRFLLEHGADPNLGNPLICGLWHPETSPEELEALLSAGADPLAQAEEGMNALEWAEDGGDEDFLRILNRAARRRNRDA